MSQSDYIKLKVISVGLSNFNNTNTPQILNSQLYTMYKGYSLQKSIINTKPTYNSLDIPNAKYLFDIPLTSVDLSNNCSNFITCTNTNLRPNRI